MGTRQTYTIAFVEGSLSPNSLTFKEEDGMDFQATTVKLPDGEYVPFLFKETNKVFDVGKGAIEMEVNKVNQELGEIGGVFVSKQPSDTDMGAKAPKTILLKGVFYGKVV